MATGNVYIGSNADSVETSDALGEYSRVVITSNGKEIQSYGDASGRTLTVENPYASSNGSLAKNMWEKINGYNYKPMTVTNARTPPTAEIGDGMTANGTYSGIFSESKSYGHVTGNTVAAGNDEELDHEFPQNGNNKYATYTGLAAGTTTVNGKGLKKGTVTGGSDGAIAQTTVTSGNTTFSNTLDQVDTNASSISTIWGKCSGYDNYFAGVSVADHIQVTSFAVQAGWGSAPHPVVWKYSSAIGGYYLGMS